MDYEDFVDACLTDLGFWIPHEGAGFLAGIPDNMPSEWINRHGLLAVTSAIFRSCGLPKGSRILICPDNTAWLVYLTVLLPN